MTTPCRVPFAALLALVACGGTSSRPAAEPVPAEPVATPVAPESTDQAANQAGDAEAQATPELAWSAMSHDQRRDYMKAKVLPQMKAKFSAFDAKRFGAMTCATCHGDGAADGSFKMPNPKLPALKADGAFFEKLMKDKPAITQFMADTVKTDMASLLGEAPFDPATGKGFGCFECHPKAP